jgi:hypothetical protein
MNQPVSVASAPAGSPLAEYRLSPFGLANVIFGALFALLIAAGGFLLGITKLQTEPVSALVIWGLSLLFLIGGVLYVRKFWPTVGRVQVLSDGLRLIKGAQVDVCRWEEITHVWQAVTRHTTYGIPSGTTHYYRVQRADGAQFTFTDALGKVERLGETIQRETFPYLLDRAATLYNEGQTVAFGKISISKVGVSNGQELLPWGDVKGIKLDNGVINISKQGRWLAWKSVSVAATPNVFVFLEMVRRITSTP